MTPHIPAPRRPGAPEVVGLPDAPHGTWDTATAEYGPVTAAAVRSAAVLDQPRPGTPEPLRSRLAMGLVAAFIAMITIVVWLTQPPATTTPRGDAAPTTGAAPVVVPPASPSTSASPSATPSATVTATPSRRPTTAPPTTTRPTTAAPTTAGRKAPQPASLTVGAQRSLRYASSTDVYVVRSSGVAALAEVTTANGPTLRHAANFTVVAGLARSSCFSFRTGNGAYLRHRNYRIYVEVDNENDPNLFRRDATFCKAAGAPPGSFRFSSENFPEYFIHARDGGLWIDKAPPPHESSFVVSTAWE
ncbi:hypothetical protein GCM10009682_45190 [Luedemannella flava]|uniref:Alpha-L-arabinofuranosidase B arabinose-binding domain-containing protein n=1 Tax=Luedemannella flava TaxID=349316 RepID=A0ABN2MEY2_9ACTN